MDLFKRTGTGQSLIAPFSLAGEYGCTAANCRKMDFRYQHLDMLRKCSFHAINRITSSAMRILSPKKYSLAPGMLNPERKSPSMPTVEMFSPMKIYAVHDEIFFDRFMHFPGAAGAAGAFTWQFLSFF